MHRVQSTIALAALAVITIPMGCATSQETNTSQETKTILVELEYIYIKDTNCVTGIEVSIPDSTYHGPSSPKDVEIEKSTMNNVLYAIQWKLAPAGGSDEAKIPWHIKKIAGDSDMCKNSYDLPSGTVSKSCDPETTKSRGPDITETWTYDVIPVHDKDCKDVNADPAIIFRGGGATVLGNPYLVIGVLLLGTALLVIAWFQWSKRHRKAG